MEKHLQEERIYRDLYDLQAAHSSQVASSVYSQSTTDPYFMSRDDLYENHRCSIKWQELFGFDGLVADTQNATSTDKPLELESLHESPVITASENRIESYLDQSANPPAPHHASVVVPLNRQMTLIDAKDRLSPEAYASASKLLQKFLSDPRAKFKTDEQCTAVALIMLSITNLLVVLPTNGGKSLLYQLASFLRPESFEIVIIPLTALLHDSVRKCRAIGIHCTTYEPTMRPYTDMYSLIFVQVEYLALPAFSQYVNARPVS
jgi:hypothetical protein